MEHKEEIFQWKGATAHLVFPFDYTLREGKEVFGYNIKEYSDYVLNNPFFKDVLMGLVMPSDISEKPSKTPPIPLEAMPLLNCFYQLSKKKEPNYYEDFFFGINKPFVDTIKNFWLDLCIELYKFIAPPQSGERQDFYAFCRHILFQNEAFTSALIIPLWDKEVQSRIKEIKELAKQVSFDKQIGVIKDCLLTLDRSILTIKSQVQSGASLDLPPDSYPTLANSLQEMLKSLLSIRYQYQKSERNSIVYDLPNIVLPDGTTLKEACKHIYRQGKISEEVKNKISMAREAYLFHLDNEIKRDDKSQEFEQQYVNLQEYLAAKSSLKIDDLPDKVLENCKHFCQQVIDYCTFAPPWETRPMPYIASSSYKDDLFDTLIYQYMNQKIASFQYLFQIISYQSAAQMVTSRNEKYELRVLFELENLIMNVPEPSEDLAAILSKIKSFSREHLMLHQITPQESVTEMNPFYHEVIAFCPHLKHIWAFLYGKDRPLFDKGTYHFHNINDIAAAIWKDGNSAADFFSRKLPFSSQREVYCAFGICDYIISHQEDLFHPGDFHNSVAKISLTLLLQILQKIVKDNHQGLVEYLKPLLLS